MTTTISTPKFLKPSDIEDNPWTQDRTDSDAVEHSTFVYNRHISLSIEQQRQKLPIFRNRNHLLYLLERFQTVVLLGDAGCGKSTQVPQYLVEAEWTKDAKIVGVTQPRRVAATTLAMRTADETGTLVGQLVGYSIRFNECYDRQNTKIKYMTEGILIQEMMGDPLLQQYCVIMLDEVHERTLVTDILLGLMRKILKKRKDLRLIISSATLDAEEMRNFFNFQSESDKKETSAILAIQGRTYPVDIHYLHEPTPDYVQGAVETVLKIHKTEPDGDILVFLTGQDEVTTAVTLLQSHSEDQQHSSGILWPLPMYGSLSSHEQLKVFRPTPKGLRKVVVATNIAETSITITGIVYVVDGGFVKLRWFYPEAYTDALVIVPTSQAGADQRAGRAGRTRAGKVYRLYQVSEFEKLPRYTCPEMQRSDLALAVLQLKALGIKNIVRFHFPSAPPSKNLISALEILYALEALDDDGNLTKPIGEQMAEFPLHPCISKMLLASGIYGCAVEILTIVACLQVENIFISPYRGNASVKARIAKRKFEVEEGDLITLLNIFNAAEKQNFSKQWCHQHFINYKGLKRAKEIRSRLTKMVVRYNVPLVSAGDNLDTIRHCITAGLFANAAYLHYSGDYHTVRGDQVLFIHPNSVLFTIEQPQWVLFVEVLHTNKLYMRDLTVIQPEWLEQYAPHFYEKVISKHYSK